MTAYAVVEAEKSLLGGGDIKNALCCFCEPFTNRGELLVASIFEQLSP